MSNAFLRLAQLKALSGVRPGGGVEVLVLAVAEPVEVDHERPALGRRRGQGDRGVERDPVPARDQPGALMDPLWPGGSRGARAGSPWPRTATGRHRGRSAGMASATWPWSIPVRGPLGRFAAFYGPTPHVRPLRCAGRPGNGEEIESQETSGGSGGPARSLRRHCDAGSRYGQCRSRTIQLDHGYMKISGSPNPIKIVDDNVTPNPIVLTVEYASGTTGPSRLTTRTREPSTSRFTRSRSRSHQVRDSGHAQYRGDPGPG